MVLKLVRTKRGMPVCLLIEASRVSGDTKRLLYWNKMIQLHIIRGTDLYYYTLFCEPGVLVDKDLWDINCFVEA